MPKTNLLSILAAEALKVSTIDLHLKLNRKEHRTNDFEQSDLIVRRGQGVKLSLTFDRMVDEEHDNIVLQFSFGKLPVPVNWLHIQCTDVTFNPEYEIGVHIQRLGWSFKYIHPTAK